MPKNKKGSRFCKDCERYISVDKLSRSGLCRECGIERMIKATDLMRAIRGSQNAKTNTMDNKA